MKPLLKLATGLVALVALAALLWMTWQWIRPIPALDIQRFTRLATAGQTAAAEELLRAHLQRDPNNPKANYLLATLILDNPNAAISDEAAAAQATETLAMLAKFSPPTPQEEALLKLYEGKALYILKRWGEVESRMLEALQIDPTVPEAGWALLDLYYVQGRARDASELALRLHESEPDPRDRVQLLLELVRQDAQPPDAASLVDLFRPAHEAEPDNVRTSVYLGLALIRNSNADEGLSLLREAVERNPRDPVAWEGLLAGLDEAGQLEAKAETLEKIPDALAPDPRFAKARGRVAQERGDWEATVDAYQEAFAQDPHDPILLYRLSRALRFAGQTEESDRLMEIHDSYKQAMRDVRLLYQEANGIPTLGLRPFPDLYQRLADLRDRLLWPEQAEAWRQLAQTELNTATAPAVPDAAGGSEAGG